MIKLYHGTDCLFDAPDLAKCNPNKDFGRGFYLTPDLAAAKRMAERANERDGWSGGPRYVLAYLLDEAAIADLTVKRFALPLNEECARFVMANRLPRARAADHNRDNRYDLVIGPVADDKMVGLFKMFERGIWTIERVVEELRYKKLTVQYSFHTAKALSKLTFKEAKRV